METGVVKWFNSDRGYGFIAPDGGGNDIFVHAKQVQPVMDLSVGDTVSFEIGTDSRSRKACAINVRLLDAGARVA